MIKNEQTLTIIVDNKIYVFPTEFSFYDELLDAIVKEDKDKIIVLYNFAHNIMNGKVELSEDSITINGIKVPNKVTANDKLLKFINKLKSAGIVDKDIEYIRPFIKNMFENTYINAVEELYDFCEAQDFVITEDGCFLAYKNVSNEYKSVHPCTDGTHLDHSIGTIVEEHYFDTDRTQTCSKGLHFCSKGYLSSYPGSRTMIVKVNPKDVVAIPVDYNFMKGRCRKYEVVDEINKEDNLKSYYRNK